MIGQESLLNKLKSYPIFEFPHSILLVGEEGCGKHTIAEEISKYFDFEFLDITNSINLDTIVEINQRLVSTMYLINVNKLTDREQNIILKFLEEPSRYAYIVLISEGTFNLLETIVNRCILFEFEPYTKDQLAHFYDGDDLDKVLKICSTPGQVKNININNLSSLLEFCHNFKQTLKSTSYFKTQMLSNMINYGEEYDKYDLKVFIRALLDALYESYINDNDYDCYKMYQLIDIELRKLRDARLNKKHFFLSLITKLWEIVNG